MEIFKTSEQADNFATEQLGIGWENDDNNKYSRNSVKCDCGETACNNYIYWHNNADNGFTQLVVGICEHCGQDY